MNRRHFLRSLALGAGAAAAAPVLALVPKPKPVCVIKPVVRTFTLRSHACSVELMQTQWLQTTRTTQHCSPEYLATLERIMDGSDGRALCRPFA